MMNPHNMNMNTAALLLSPFLLMTGFDVSADGNMINNPENYVCQYFGSSAPCWVATEVNCSYVPPIRGIASGGPSSVVYPSEPKKCSSGSSGGGGGGVAPPFVPPTGVIMAATVTSYYHNDALGSPVSATDDAGEIVWTEEYRPYGDRILKQDEGANDLWYTGKPHEEEFGLSYFGARWYDPATGRFTGMDPAAVDAENLYTFNRYMYANNNPYRYVDPDGRWTISATKIVTNTRRNTTAFVYHIDFTEGGFFAAAAQTIAEKASKATKKIVKTLDAGDTILDYLIGYDAGPIGDNQFNGIDSVTAKSYDPDIREAFKNKLGVDPQGMTGFSNVAMDQKDHIRTIVSTIWSSMPDEAKEIYKRNGLGSVDDIINAANAAAYKGASAIVWGEDKND